MAYTTIDDPEKYFQSLAYTGQGGDNDAYTLSGDENLQPDLVWIKNRGTTNEHLMIDSVRGALKALNSNDATAEDSISNSLKSFNSDGFTLGGNASCNANNNTYASWNWKESATAGFDIVTYSGSAASSKTISHSLNAVPKMIIVKCRSAAENWSVYHHALGNTHALFLNTNGASSDTPVFADTTPTSSVFSVSADDRTGADGKTYVAYVFAEKQGFSKFGSYVGNGNADGTFVYTGFKPAFVMAKKSSGTEDWSITDNKMNTFNVCNNKLRPNSTSQESTGNAHIDFTAQGFKWRSTSGEFNASGSTYIYMAFAENPFVTSSGVPATAR